MPRPWEATSHDLTSILVTMIVTLNMVLNLCGVHGHGLAQIRGPQPLCLKWKHHNVCSKPLAITKTYVGSGLGRGNHAKPWQGHMVTKCTPFCTFFHPLCIPLHTLSFRLQVIILLTSFQLYFIPIQVSTTLELFLSKILLKQS